MTIIRNSHAPGKSSELKGATFTGDVWAEPIFGDANINMGHVTFTPCARTHWHTHEGGQVLRVLAGSGWVCDKGGEPQRLGVGDMVWAPPGTTHWHGGDDCTYMTHLAISYGKTTWLEAVDDAEYKKRAQ